MSPPINILINELKNNYNNFSVIEIEYGDQSNPDKPRSYYMASVSALDVVFESTGTTEEVTVTNLFISLIDSYLDRAEALLKSGFNSIFDDWYKGDKRYSERINASILYSTEAMKLQILLENYNDGRLD